MVGDIQALARANTEMAIATLATICENANVPPAARVAAAVALLDRGWGRPTQALSVEQKPPPSVKITDEMDSKQAAEEYRALLARA
jgi:hypothetical protein